MTTVGYALIVLAVFVVLGMTRGRSITDLPEDINAFVTAIIMGDYKAIEAVLARRTEPTDYSAISKAAGKIGEPGSPESQSAANKATSAGGWTAPVIGRVTSPWGVDRGTYKHEGTDFSVPQGTPVRAAASGAIVFAGTAGTGLTSGRTGYAVVIRHAVGDTYYGHLSKIDVKVGDRVSVGQTIGASGGQKGTPGAGNSTGPHLHFEYRPQSGSTKTVDPLGFLRSMGVSI